MSRRPATGTIFGDVPLGAFAAAWIEELYNRGITGGCQASPLLYCPDKPNTRGQMAVFLTKTFSPAVEARRRPSHPKARRPSTARCICAQLHNP